MGKKINKFGIYLIALSIFLVPVVMELAGDRYENHFAYKYAQIGIAAFSALLAALEFLSQYFDRVDNAKRTLFRWLKILPSKNEIDGAINARSLLNNKGNLLEKSQKLCNEFLGSMDRASTLLSLEGGIELESRYYQNFADFGNGIVSSVPNTPPESATLVKYLFIGTAGIGKTYQLLQQFNESILRVKNGLQQDPDLQIPVFLSLAAWEFEISFDDYVVAQLPKIYQSSSPAMLRMLFERKELVLFVDGLDEVKKVFQSDCLQSILEYALENDIIFNCREEQFRKLLPGLTGTNEHVGVLVLEELSPDTVTKTIRSAKHNASEMLAFLEQNPQIMGYLQSPLLLNLFVTVSDSLTGAQQDKLATMNPQDFEYELWSYYDTLMFERKLASISKKGWTPTEVRSYIVSFAQNMNRNGGEFLLEQLQPSWLGSPKRELLYYLTSRILSGIVLTIGIGFFIASPLDLIGNGILASIAVALVTIFINKNRNSNVFAFWNTVLIFLVLLITLCGLYQGFVVPRTDNKLFSSQESYAGMLLGIFTGVVCGFRKGIKDLDARTDVEIDIKPMADVDRDLKTILPKALKYGLRGGLIIGIMLCVLAFLIRLSDGSHEFHGWLKSWTSQYCGFLSFPDDLEWELNSRIILLAFFTGFIIGFVVFAMLGARIAKNVNASSVSYNSNLNNGIQKSFRFSLIYGLVVSVVMTFFYACIIAFLNKHLDMRSAIKMGIGSGIISFLWFGGFEVIQHCCLRFYLYVYGIAPLRFAKWLKIMEDLAFTKRLGIIVKFYHFNLGHYFSMLPENQKASNEIADQQKKSIRRLAVFALVTISTVLMAMPFLNRFVFDRYDWVNEKQIHFSNNGKALANCNVQCGCHTVFKAKDDLTLGLKVSGLVKLGTFTGYSNASGVENALMGFPIDTIYNIKGISRCRHGALLYRVFRNGAVGHWKEVADHRTVGPVRIDAQIRLKKDDYIEFIVNDKEFQNNVGNYHVDLYQLKQPDPSVEKKHKTKA